MADGKEGEGAKGEEGKKGDEGAKGKEEAKKEPVPYERFESELARRHKAEAETAALKKEKAEGATKALEDQKKFEELWKGAEPKVKLADELAKSVGEYLAAETADLSDEHKALIPEGPAHIQLGWVKKAKAAGVFGKQNPPDKTFSGKTKTGLPPDKWYLELKSDDPRFKDLSGSQFQEWKTHNRQSQGVSVRGGF